MLRCSIIMVTGCGAGPCGAHCGTAKMSGNHVWRNGRLEAETALPAWLLDKPITCVEYT
jgi:hypothetical protein